jgi:hypothetical protein
MTYPRHLPLEEVAATQPSLISDSQGNPLIPLTPARLPSDARRNKLCSRAFDISAEPAGNGSFSE